MVEAYLGHRLNNHELVDLVRRSEGAAESFEDSFSSYSGRETDWRGETTPEQVGEALDSLARSGDGPSRGRGEDAGGESKGERHLNDWSPRR